MPLTPKLLHHALSLSASERAALARELLLSLEQTLEPKEECEAAWAQEVDARLRSADGSKAESWEVVQKRIRARLKRKV